MVKSRKRLHTGTAAALLLLVAMLPVRLTDAACNSAILQLVPHDWDKLASPGCFPDTIANANSVKALCLMGVRVFVEEPPTGRIIRLVPLPTLTISFRYVNWPWTITSMACKDFNASGLFSNGGTSKTAATVRLYDDLAGNGITRLTATASGVIRLTPGRSLGYPAPNCAYNFTVVEGCILGLRATAPLRSCPPGYHFAKGVRSIKYCAPCAPGTSSLGGGATKCLPCPLGSYSSFYGMKCTKCLPGTFAPTAGAQTCQPCSVVDGTAVDKWTDGKTCTACPANSSASPLANPRQCVKCIAGKKCCTVNWDASCPKCSTAEAAISSYSSIFALASASTPSCLNTIHAVCAPKFRVRMDGTCSVTLQSLQLKDVPDADCQWTTNVGFRGPTIKPVRDFASFPLSSKPGVSILDGNVTSATGPFLDFYIPSTKCTLTYRALTAPNATFLGIQPAPAPEGTCPPGSYIEQATTAKPGPCLPCPPGTYSTIANSTRCRACRSRTYASGFGATRCVACPAGKPFTDSIGSVACRFCDFGEVFTGSQCESCPNNTATAAAGLPCCLGKRNGVVCCALWNCQGQTPCPGTLPAAQQDSNQGVILQVVAKRLTQPQCRKAGALMDCLVRGAFVGLEANIPPFFTLVPLNSPTCVAPDATGAMVPVTANGSYRTTQRAGIAFTTYTATGNVAYASGYHLLANPAQQTITLYLSRIPDPTAVSTINATRCHVVLRPWMGRAFNLTAPAAATCPANTRPVSVGSHRFCRWCPAGQFMLPTGTCGRCSKGTYQPLQGTGSCKPCPAGSSCPDDGATVAQLCGKGYFTAAPGSTSCDICRYDTYANRMLGATECRKCPKNTGAPWGSPACGVPFMKSFPAVFPRTSRR